MPVENLSKNWRSLDHSGIMSNKVNFAFLDMRDSEFLVILAIQTLKVLNFKVLDFRM